MFGNLGDMMGKLQEMKRKTEEIKAALDLKTIKTEAAGGDIQIEINGNKKLLNISIAPGLQHGDKEELEEQLCVAINRAIAKAEELHEAEMKSVASGMLPGMF